MKNDIKNAFEKITPVRSNDEILSYVLRRSNDMENMTSKKKISFKKPAIAICAAAAAATLCVTSAAAAGLFRFDDIFGSRIKAENNDLGEALMCSAENFTYTVSDDDYKIELNGISGSATEIIANIEISRVDGTPMVDSFVNEYDPEDGLHAHEEWLIKSGDMKDYERYLGGTGKYSINEEGNIEAVYVIGNTEIDGVSVANETIEISGARLYPIDKYLDFLIEENGGTYSFHNGEIKYYKNNTEDEIELDTSSVHYLDLFWSAEFTYVPSEEALKTIRNAHTTDEKFDITLVSADENNETSEFIGTIDINNILMTSTYATIEFDMEYDAPDVSFPFPDFEEVYLVRGNGSKIPMFLHSGHGPYKGGFVATLRYYSYLKYNGDGSFFIDYIAVDLTDAVGVEINGNLYEF